MTDLLNMLDTYGVGLLFLVMLLKEVGVPVPLPGDLLMLLAGARAAAGRLELWQVIGALLLAGCVGAYAQYMLARGPGRGFIYRFGKYVGLTSARLDKATAAMKGRGWVAIALGRALPGLRVGAVAACGLAAVPVPTFAAGLLAGTLLFVGFHTLLGYFAGPGVSDILSALNVPLLPVVVVLAVVGLAGWLVIKWRRRRARGTVQEDAAQPVFDWADACCPACLAAAAIERRVSAANS